MASSYTSSPRAGTDVDFDENDSLDLNDDDDLFYEETDEGDSFVRVLRINHKSSKYGSLHASPSRARHQDTPLPCMGIEAAITVIARIPQRQICLSSVHLMVAVYPSTCNEGC